MKTSTGIIILIILALTQVGCDDVQTERILRGSAGAVNAYYGQGYYGQPVTNTTVVTPAAPVYPVTY